ncbi:MAG: amidohydrolase/deacetylase family metallohydrolase [Cyclobacteriaceae bacterium]|nr:amidohydrolase/deacetylase family metallohydrolase [Cyclobacteriaceae bacterium]
MKKMCTRFGWAVILLLLSTRFTIAQPYDMVIKNATVVDPKNNIQEILDVAIHDGKIARVERSIDPGDNGQVIDAAGLYLVPGIIDMHVHVFHGTEPDAYISNSFTSVPPDAFSFRSGVTTVVDAGSAGWRNFDIFKSQTIDGSETRVLAFLNIVGYGMKGGQVEQNLMDMDAEQTAYMANKYADLIVGVKVAHYSGPEWDPVERAVKAGTIADIPVMIDFGGHMPELSLETLLMEKLRPGDIFTHAFAHVRGRTPIVDESSRVRPFVRAARQRGIIFDVGHGGGSFLFEQAIPALDQGFRPNAISTDLHTGSMNGGMKDMLNVMSKFLNMNVSFPEIIAQSTWYPAQCIKREDLGHLSVDAVADLALIKIEEGEFGYIDTGGHKIKGNQKLVCELTLREGNVVWDLNGISRPEWGKNNEQ